MNKANLYETYYRQRDYTLLDVFRILKSEFPINKVIYPGSYVQISPSFIFPETLYIDTDRQAKKFFNAPSLAEYIHQQKEYTEEVVVHFIPQSYTEFIEEYRNQFDLLISLFAGFISEPCKPYLKPGGYLLCNNSHGDAGLAALDADFKLIGALNKNNGKYQLNTSKLCDYFKPKKDIRLSREYLMSLKRGLGYTKTASLYLFQL